MYPTPIRSVLITTQWHCTTTLWGGFVMLTFTEIVLQRRAHSTRELIELAQIARDTMLIGLNQSECELEKYFYSLLAADFCYDFFSWVCDFIGISAQCVDFADSTHRYTSWVISKAVRERKSWTKNRIFIAINTMLTKEYRIAMPLTVKEYQIGQVSVTSCRFSHTTVSLPAAHTCLFAALHDCKTLQRAVAGRRRWGWSCR